MNEPKLIRNCGVGVADKSIGIARNFGESLVMLRRFTVKTDGFDHIAVICV